MQLSDPDLTHQTVEPQHDRLNVTRTNRGWSVAGELDAVTAEQLVQAFGDLPEVDAGPIEVDLAAVTFIDSSGLRALLELADRADAAGAETLIKNPSKQVSRLLVITHLEDRFGLT